MMDIKGKIGMLKNFVEDIEIFAQKIIKTLIRQGCRPNHFFSWSLEIARGHDKEIGAQEYEKMMEFLLKNEWVCRLNQQEIMITDWGASEALGI